VLKKNHTLLNIVFVRGEVVTRRARVWKLGAELLFFAAGVALGDSLSYPDPGCEDERNESGCLKFANGLGTRRACSWTCAGTCEYREPGPDALASAEAPRPRPRERRSARPRSPVLGNLVPRVRVGSHAARGFQCSITRRLTSC
jgi:hypothetical protein